MLLPFTPKRKGKLFFWSFHHCPRIRTSVLAATIYTGKKREAPLPSLPADKDFCPCCYHIHRKEQEAPHLELPSLPADKDFCPCCYHVRGKEKSFHRYPQKSISTFAAAIYKEKKRKFFFWSFHHCPRIRTSVLAATIYTGKKREAPLPSLPADKDFCPCCYHLHRKEKGSSSFGASIIARR